MNAEQSNAGEGLTWSEALTLPTGTLVEDVSTGDRGTVGTPSLSGCFRVEWDDRYSRELHDFLASTEWDFLADDCEAPLSVRVVGFAEQAADAEAAAAGLDPSEQRALVARLGEVLS